MSRANRAVSVISLYLIVALGAYGSLACFLSSFQMWADHTRLIILTLVFAGISVALYAQKKWKLRFVGLCAFVAAAIYAALFFDTLYTQALCVFYRMLTIGAQELGRAAPLIPATLQADWQTADLTTFFVLVLFGISVFFGWAAVAQKSFGFAFLGSMLLLSTPFFLTLTPDWPQLLMVLAFFTAMLFVGAAKNNFHANLSHGGITLLVLSLCAALLVRSLIPENTYERSDVLNDIRTQFDVLELNNRLKIFEGFGRSGGPGDIDFKGMGNRTFNGARMLTIKDTTRQGQYLKGNTGAIYTGMGFASLAEEEYRALMGALRVSPHNLYLIRGGGRKRIELTYDQADPSTVYAPYELLSTPSELSDMTFETDSAIKKPRIPKEVTLYAADRAEGTTGTGMEEDFALYREFVNRHYLSVPADLKERLIGALEPIVERNREGGQTDDDYTMAVLGSVNDYLNGNTSYTLSPGVTPYNSDFVEYFLFTGKKGYCVHYATAAVMMYRSLGIPARYAEGFVVRSSDYSSDGVADIPDRQAHAWAEVFFTDIGWQPIEVTPGADALYAPPAQRTDEPEPASPAQSAEAVIPTPVPLPGDTAKGDGEDMSDGAGQAFPMGLVLAALVIALFIAVRAFVLDRRKKRFAAGSDNAAAIAMYRYLMCLTRFGGTPPLEHIVRLAEKAQFSQHKLNEQEIEEMRSFAAMKRTETWKRAGAATKAALFISML